jgi:hypothetical protein
MKSHSSWVVIGGLLLVILGSALVIFGTMGASIPLIVIGAGILGGVVGAMPFV